MSRIVDDPSLQSADAKDVLGQVARILTAGEQIIGVAIQNKGKAVMAPKKGALVATGNRLIYLKPKMLGGADFVDFHWREIAEVHLKQGMIAGELIIETLEGKKEEIGNLDKDQASRLYSTCQQMEEEWHEKRRQLELETARAKAGGVYVTSPTGHPQATPAPAPEDPVVKLGKAKAMLNQGLITQEEYDAVKAKILAAM